MSRHVKGKGKQMENQFVAFVAHIARMSRNQECMKCRADMTENCEIAGHREFDMESDDAVETLNGLIRRARILLQQP